MPPSAHFCPLLAISMSSPGTPAAPAGGPAGSPAAPAAPAAAAPTASSTASPVLRAPSKYAHARAHAAPSFAPPSPVWLLRTWTVTHSTLHMWRSAQNVRITYSCDGAENGTCASPDGKTSGNQDRVDYEDQKTGRAHAVEGANTPDPAIPGAFCWRGKGWLFFITSHWEILGWGETEPDSDEGRERWVVTWFAPTLFTREGIDFYSDRADGMLPATAAALLKTAEAWPEPLASLARQLLPVAIKLKEGLL